MIKKNILLKIVFFSTSSVILILILGFCYLFRPFSVFRPEYNSATEIITYNNIEDAPTDIKELLNSQQAKGLYVDTIDNNTFLVHYNKHKDEYLINIKISARLRNRVLHIKINQKDTWDENSNNTPGELIAIIKVPDDKKIKDIDVCTKFRKPILYSWSPPNS